MKKGYAIVLAMLCVAFFGFLIYSECLPRCNLYPDYKLQSFYIDNPLSNPTAVLQIYSSDEENLHIDIEATLGSGYAVAWGWKIVHFESGETQTIRIPLHLPSDPLSPFGEREYHYDKVTIQINNRKFIR